MIPFNKIDKLTGDRIPTWEIIVAYVIYIVIGIATVIAGYYGGNH